MPYERTRMQNGGSVVYEPSNVISNKYIQQYGSFNWKNLCRRRSICRIVLLCGQIARSTSHNREQLGNFGMDIKNEQAREGR